MEFKEVHRFLNQEKLKNDNYEDDIIYNDDTSDDAWDNNNNVIERYQSNYHYYYSINNNNNISLTEKNNINVKKKRKKKKKERTLSRKLAYGVQKIKNKLEGLSSSMSASSDSDESIYSTYSDDHRLNTFSHLFKDQNAIQPVLLKNIQSPILSPIPNNHHHRHPSFHERSLINKKNKNIVQPLPLTLPLLQKYHESRSSTFSSTTTTSSSSSTSTSSNYKLKNKSYYSKRAKVKRHLGFFWRHRHRHHHHHHHHHQHKPKLLKSNNNNNNKLLTLITSPSIKGQQYLSNLKYPLNQSHDPSSPEKATLTFINRTPIELLNQISNNIQRLQCMIDIEIQSVEDHQRDILFYTNQLEQLDNDIDYLNHKINTINIESKTNVKSLKEEIQDWHSLLLQLQQDHHLILNRFESYMRYILSKNTFQSLQMKTDITLKNIHQMNIISYWSLLITCK